MVIAGEQYVGITFNGWGVEPIAHPPDIRINPLVPYPDDLLNQVILAHLPIDQDEPATVSIQG
jgi:hypothetical protein